MSSSMTIRWLAAQLPRTRTISSILWNCSKGRSPCRGTNLYFARFSSTDDANYKPPEGWRVDDENETAEQRRKREEERKEKYRKKYTVNTDIIQRDFFEEIRNKNKETFLESIDIFIMRDKFARGHVEFIQSALQRMKEFGVHKDLDAYKKLLDVFPKGKMVATNIWQVEFMHFPKQQFCAINLLEQMEDNGVMGDSEVEDTLIAIFGSRSFPHRKHGRMMYWLPKFKNISPWKLPDPLPRDGFELCKLAIQRITSVDLQTRISIYYARFLEDAIDQTWIISGQSPTQQALIESHPKNQPIYVEGAFRIWLKDQCINYFILRSEPKQLPTKEEEDIDDVGSIGHPLASLDEVAIAEPRSVHEQDDGVILAVCATGTSSRDSLLSWIRFLQETNPRLEKDIPVLFSLKSPIGPTDDLEAVTAEGEQQASLEGSEEMIAQGVLGVGMGLDRSDPDVSQVGVWKLSDTRFVNWPHHHNKKVQQEEPEKLSTSSTTKLESKSSIKDISKPTTDT